MRTRIGKINFDVLSFNGAIDIISDLILTDNKCSQVVVANVFSVVLSEKDKEFCNVCKNAEITIADGQPIVFFSRYFGHKLPERIAGPDFMWRFSKVCAQKGFKMFLLGGVEPFLTNLKNNLEKSFKEIKIVGKYSPPFGIWTEEETEKMISLINHSGAEVLWLGVSTPKQDKWIQLVKHRLKTKVAIAVGAAFDFHSGKTNRAPVWIQKIGFEWFHRLLQDPKRLWKRYLIGNFEFVLIIIRQFLENTFKKN